MINIMPTHILQQHISSISFSSFLKDTLSNIKVRVCQKAHCKKVHIFSHFCLSGICANVSANYLHFLSKQNISTSPPVKNIAHSCVNKLFTELIWKSQHLRIFLHFFLYYFVKIFAGHENLADFHDYLHFCERCFREISTLGHLQQCSSVLLHYALSLSCLSLNGFLRSCIFPSLFHPSLGVFANCNFKACVHTDLTTPHPYLMEVSTTAVAIISRNK